MPTPLEVLTKNEFAALAGDLSQSKDRLGASLTALSKFYEGYGLQDDQIIGGALARASQGIPAGHLGDSSVLAAMSNYSSRYAQARKGVSVGDFVSYSGYTLPADVLTAIAPYMGRTIGEIETEVKDNAQPEDVRKAGKKVLSVVNLIQRHRFEKTLYGQLVDKETEAGIRGAYPAPTTP